ncbi:MAG: MarR family EPS-associated transcriptional regulator [Deltaproteobacteria bacterium]|nr:MarR family EPS-associated transcriptional regulator [Deltaproteobacteria bacterium]
MNEHHLKTLKELSKDSALSQRDLSKRLGLSLGRVNYVMNALLDKGLVKAERFKNSKNKLAYMYILTPEGIKEKVGLTYHFLQRKKEEYDSLGMEIEELRRELETGEKLSSLPACKPASRAASKKDGRKTNEAVIKDIHSSFRTEEF